MINFKYKIINYIKLMRLDKPIGIFLLLWPCLIAIWLASNGKPDPKIVLIFIFGVILTRSAGCIINDILDRNFDGFVERTQFRPLITKTVSVKEALIITFILLFFSLILVLNLNILTLYCSIAALLTILLYPLMKRFISVPQLVLGVAFSWSIPMAFIAQEKIINHNTWYLYCATILWIIAYDTLYAMADSKDDQKIGIKSSALLFGEYSAKFVFLLQFSSLLLFFILGHGLKLGIYYFSGLGISFVLMIYQQYLIKNKEPQKCIQAFLNNNYFGASLFLGIFLDYVN